MLPIILYGLQKSGTFFTLPVFTVLTQAWLRGEALTCGT